MSIVIGWMAYGKSWRQKMGGKPSIRWSDASESLSQNGERPEVKAFTQTLRNVVVEERLDQMIGGARAMVLDEEVQSNMGRIVDNLLRLGAGQSFATNVKVA
ncbi:hypothetical protein EDB81DRAFT_306875 [Dactylonectria macrodidyma]|uniref:Uncharacterized protein n=1 Tax=Dactylonectria macrodidyma TaxID=307937 RepID=A0A9P9IAA9_9HYPO|nr:hypothetical protein EDB81DRAFT_306875 [Dactylonectria macrodidyma]